METFNSGRNHDYGVSRKLIFNVILIDDELTLGTVSTNWTINLQLVMLSNWWRFVSGTYIQSTREKLPEMTKNLLAIT